MYDGIPSSLADGGTILTFDEKSNDIVIDGSKVAAGHPDSFTMYFWGRQPSE